MPPRRAFRAAVEVSAYIPVMAKGRADDATSLLAQWRDGDTDARDRLVALLYDELRAIAHRHLNRENAGHTLQTTAVVNELYLRLMGQRRVDFADRAHFLGVAAHVMRRILVDYARGRSASKRSDARRVSVTDVSALPVAGEGVHMDETLSLDRALDKLHAIDPRAAQLTELRHFAGLTWEESAEVLGVSPATVKRDWVVARAFLLRELRDERPHA
jgi:RNA polymerase sigma factor (TIGR02999 family)